MAAWAWVKLIQPSAFRKSEATHLRSSLLLSDRRKTGMFAAKSRKQPGPSSLVLAGICFLTQPSLPRQTSSSYRSLTQLQAATWQKATWHEQAEPPNLRFQAQDNPPPAVTRPFSPDARLSPDPAGIRTNQFLYQAVPKLEDAFAIITK